MIGRLQGKLIAKQPPQLLLDVNGVGYELEASMQTFYNLPELEQSLSLHTHLIVREDAHILYAFYTLEERSLFRILIKVNGVGPKLALTILSSIMPAEFVSCVQQQDAKSLIQVPGIGKKMADRLLIEMRDKLKIWQGNTKETVRVNESVVVRKSASQEAINALIALGYKPQEASRTVALIDAEGMSTEDLIRESLKQVAN